MSRVPLNAFTSTSVSGVTYGSNFGSRTGTRPTGSAHLYRRTTVDQNTDRLSAAFTRVLNESGAGLDDAEKAAAKSAANEAVSVISALFFSEMPWIGITDDCTAMVQWQKGDDGVVFSFTGRGVFGMASKKGADSRYSDHYQEGRVGDALPSGIRDAIVALSQMKDVPAG